MACPPPVSVGLQGETDAMTSNARPRTRRSTTTDATPEATEPTLASSAGSKPSSASSKASTSTPAAQKATSAAQKATPATTKNPSTTGKAAAHAPSASAASKPGAAKPSMSAPKPSDAAPKPSGAAPKAAAGAPKANAAKASAAKGSATKPSSAGSASKASASTKATATPDAPEPTAKRSRAKAAPKQPAIPPQLAALAMAPALLEAGPDAPPSAESAGAEPETSFLEPDPPTFRETAPAVDATVPEAPPVEAEPGPVESPASIAASVGASTAVPMAAAASADDDVLTDRQPSTLERRLAQLAPEPAATASSAEPAIGVPNAQLFDCPACGRPLERGTSKCSNCGTRLVAGRPMRRVATFAGIAAVVLVAVAAIGMTALATSPSQPATGGVPTTPPAASQPAATAAVPSELPAPTGIPAGAAAALGGTAVVNNRIVSDSDTLAQVLTNADSPTIDVARAMRALAADAQLGLDMTGRLTPWTDAAPVVAKLNTFYEDLTGAARDALRVSLNDATAYRAAGAGLIAKVRGLAEVDAATRELATSAGLTLPPLQAPVAPSTAPSP